MIRRPPRSTQGVSSAASDVYKRQEITDTYEQMEDEDEYDEDKLTEESYRTTIEEDPEALSLEATEIVEDDGF